MTPAPHPFLAKVATLLLQKADRSRSDAAVRLKLDRSAVPEMYAATDGDAIRLYWMLLEELAASGWVRLHLATAREFQSLLERKPALELLDFQALADWARYESRHAAWDRRFLAFLRGEQSDALGPDKPQLLEYLGRSPLWALEEIEFAEALACLSELRERCLSTRTMPVRELSALVFQGRSKVLDSRQELLRLLGAGDEQFTEVPIQLLVAAPESFDHVLFVENAVTFERMADLRQECWARALLVFAAGFRGSARRMRSSRGSRLYLRSDGRARPGDQDVIEAWLYRHAELPVYFFGDLDFSGLQILGSLREGFPGAQAWRPGYQALAALLEQGKGHSPSWADKEGQTEPPPCGCPYSDETLLPLLLKSRKFIDQEAWSPW